MSSYPAKMKVLLILAKNLLKNRNWTFIVVRYFTWKLELVSNVLWMIPGHSVVVWTVKQLCLSPVRKFMSEVNKRLNYFWKYARITHPEARSFSLSFYLYYLHPWCNEYNNFKKTFHSTFLYLRFFRNPSSLIKMVLLSI